MGLKQDIALCKNEKDVLTLLDKGSTFQMASKRTKRAWKVTAKNVLLSLQSPPKKDSVVKTEKVKTKKD